jgi:hypothetical protein
MPVSVFPANRHHPGGVGKGHESFSNKPDGEDRPVFEFRAFLPSVSAQQLNETDGSL